MRALVYRYNSICEPDILAVLKECGFEIDEITAAMYNKDMPAFETLQLVSETLKKNPYDMVFTINFFPVISEVCNIFKIPYLSWIVDSPVMELYSYSIRNSCNRIFMFDRALYDEFVAENPTGIFYLPLAANVSRIDALISDILPEDRSRFGADVSFVGSLYTEKCPYNRYKDDGSYLKGFLDGLIEAQLKVYGYNFLEECITDDMVKEFQKKVPFYQFPEKAVHNEKAVMAHLYLGNKVTEQERLRLLNSISSQFRLALYTGSDISVLPKAEMRGLARTMTEMPKIFHLSKINLNFTSKPIRTGLPLRIWDILSAGGFVLTNYQSEIPDYFEIGKDLETFSCEEELLYKIRYYLMHEEERSAIARNGYEKTKQRHSLQVRIKEMLKLAGIVKLQGENI